MKSAVGFHVHDEEYLHSIKHNLLDLFELLVARDSLVYIPVFELDGGFFGRRIGHIHNAETENRRVLPMLKVITSPSFVIWFLQLND